MSDTLHNDNTTHPILYVFYGFEAAAFIFATPALLMCCRGLTKSSILHRNLIFITQFHFCAIYGSLLPRPIFVVYGNTASTPLLFMAQFIVLFCRCTSISSFTSVLIERNFASYFVNDYEKKSRKWIALFVVLVSCILSFMYTAPVSYGIFTLGDFAILALAVCLICAIVYILLYRRDKKKLHLLTNDIQHIRYKLTARFQLTENLRVLKVIMFGSIIYFIWTLVPAVSTLLIYYCFKSPSLSAQICFAFLDTFMAMSILTLYLYTLVAIDHCCLSRYITLPCHKRREVFSSDGGKATELYFQQLDSFWK